MSKRRRHPVRPFPQLIERLEGRIMLTGEPWGAFPKLVGQDLAAANYPSITGAGTSIAILDSGINYNDPALGGGFGAGHKVVAGYDFVDNDSNPFDSDGHGTAVSSIAASTGYVYGGAKYQGVAPGADLIALRVDTGTLGWGKEQPHVEQALQWIIAHRDEYNIVAVNMSFGTGHYTSPTDLSDTSLIWDELAQLNQMGVMLVASSGNDGLQNGVPGIEYPGIDPNVYAVGAVDSNDAIWDAGKAQATERSADMDLLAPGVNVPIVYWNPLEQTRQIFPASGTSFAAPWLAGMAALLKQVDPTITTAQIMSIVADTGRPIFDAATNLTWPRININAAIARAYQMSSAGGQDDAFEANDVMSAAKTVSFSGDTVSVSGLKLLANDTDWFRFTLGAQADIDWSLTTSGSFAGPSVDLVDGSGTVIKHLSANDEIRLGAGTYYLRVNAQGTGLAGTYGFDLVQAQDDGADNHSIATATPIPLDASGQGSVADMVLLGGSDDYYSFTIDSARDTELSIDYGGSSAMPAGQLLDTNDNFVASFNGDGTLSKQLSAGRYLIRVSSANTLDGTYGVSVSAASVIVPGSNGSSNGMAYDASGRLHLAYYDEAARNLKYAERDSAGVWDKVVTVDPGLYAGQFVSLALDSLGHAGIAYYDANNADLKYAHFNGSSWDVVTVDAAFTTGYYPSLRYDASDRPIITYYYKTGADLKFAYLNAGAWVISTIDSAGDVGRYSSLALNPATGRWAVAYEDTGHGWFKYAEQTRSGWAVAVADSSTKIGGGYISLAFNPKTSRPAMSYYDAYNADLKYALFNGSRWTTQSLATKGTVGLYSTLTIEADTGVADILYYNKGADMVCRARGFGSTWSLTSVTDDGGRWISRASDAPGAETLAYVRGSGLAIIDL